MRKIKQTQDIQDQLHKSSSIVDNYQSFALGGTKKFLNITLPDVQIKGKELYKKQPYCIICFRNFTTTFRQHHCRVCVNAVCGDCSRSMVNKQRACDLCIMRLSNPQEERKKKQMLQTLQTLCAFLLYRKKMKMEQLQQIKFAQNPDKQTLQEELSKQEKQIEELQKENEVLLKQRQLAEQQMDQIRSRNSKLEENISKIQTDLTGFNF